MSATNPDLQVRRISRFAMGTEFQVIGVGDDPDFLESAANEALDQVERLEERLSHYLPDSEICDLNRRGAREPVLLEPGLLNLLQRGKSFSETSGGAFDLTAGSLVKVWGFFRGQGRMPEPGAVREALERTGSRWLELDPEERTARFLREGVEVHLGAIGKGYAVDHAVETLRLLGVHAGLVHGGTSTVYGLGAPPGQDAWAVGLRDPRDPARRIGVVRLRDRALSISGDYEQFFEHAGRRYGHILDPRTGWPAAGTWSAAVLADSATDTDALSTAAFVWGETGTRTLCNRYPGIGAVLVPAPGPGSEPEIVVLGDAELAPPDEFEEQ